nr:F-box only protein 8-like [Ipomoea batatas]
MDYTSKQLKKMDDGTSSSLTPATSIAFLPQEIILKILTGLPPKSALSLRCASKFFNSFIPKPHFAFTILFSFESRTHSAHLYTVGYTTEQSHVRLQPSSLQWSADELKRYKRLFGSSFADDNKLCLFNICGGASILDLSTRQCIYLPQTFEEPEPGSGHRTQMLASAALGFDPVSKRYKVLRAGCVKIAPHCYQGVLKVLTLGVDESWRAVTTENSNSFLPVPRKLVASVQIDGILYLINRKMHCMDEPEIAVFVFDIETENLIRVIPFPYIFQNSRLLPIPMYHSWVKLNGRLAYIYLDVKEKERTRLFVYTLEKSMGPEWDKHEVPLTLEEAKIISQAKSVSLTVNSIGEIVFLILAVNMPPSILIYALETQVWRKFEICGIPSYSPLEIMRRIIVHVIEEKVYFSE